MIWTGYDARTQCGRTMSIVKIYTNQIELNKRCPRKLTLNVNRFRLCYLLSDKRDKTLPDVVL